MKCWGLDLVLLCIQMQNSVSQDLAAPRHATPPPPTHTRAFVVQTLLHNLKLLVK